MFLAERRPLASLEIEARRGTAGVMCAALFDNVHHAISSMFPADHRCFGGLYTTGGCPCTGIMCATFVGDVHHTIRSMFLAERRLRASLKVEDRRRVARIM